MGTWLPCWHDEFAADVQSVGPNRRVLGLVSCQGRVNGHCESPNLHRLLPGGLLGIVYAADVYAAVAVVSVVEFSGTRSPASVGVPLASTCASNTCMPCPAQPGLGMLVLLLQGQTEANLRETRYPIVVHDDAWQCCCATDSDACVCCQREKE